MTGAMRDSCETLDIREFGAVVDDGEALSTEAVQRAIDACHERGGGTVLVPSGAWRIGTIYLKSHVTLNLAPGAVLRASERREDYNADDVFSENPVFSRENVTGAHLVIAYRAENVTICGEGTIDGASAQFFDPMPPGDVLTSRQVRRKKNFTVTDWRPGQMVFFCRCENVAVRDVALVNSPYWTLFLLGCRTVQVRGLRIDNPAQTPNGDGIDIDCCQDVTVSDCIIHTGDDGITLRGHCALLGDNAQACRNVAIANCVVSAPCSGMRIGVGDGVVRDCTISNMVIKDTRTGVNVISSWSEHSAGTHIDNVRFSNITMDVLMPLNVLPGVHASGAAGIRNLSFSHIRALAREGCYIGGNPDRPVRDIHVHEMDLILTGDAVDPDFGEKVASPVGTCQVPAALWARHTNGLRVSGLRVRWEETGEGWQHGVVLEKSGDIRIRDTEVTAPPGTTNGKALHCIDVEGCTVS